MLYNVIPFTANLRTNGKGLWSDVAATVRTTELVMAYLDEDEDFGELRVHFDTESWDVDSNGLIYTDPLFFNELLAALIARGFAVIDLSYSEQGMQGDDYVSLDCGPQFIRSFADRVLTA
jgi:hypothetical protein